jgi:hypothetical protein
MNKTAGRGGSTRLSRRILKLAAAHSKVPVNIESFVQSKNYFVEIKELLCNWNPSKNNWDSSKRSVVEQEPLAICAVG